MATETMKAIVVPALGAKLEVWPVKPTAPLTPGHEGVGVVVATGPGGGLHAVGDRVAIAWLGSACGHCSYCVAGWETPCESQQNSGYSVDGAWGFLPRRPRTLGPAIGVRARPGW
ncbi:MAG TPA: alcohol dehydrogenase catalytic domain-containing protein [Trebonia sp.]|jgi:D-arabinose 1-dehydrogenase-like Zn-dependent alcohol dehydrogenase|nr:alcohol dehydrogenase catalytic domain-containing protein [Trebonia sp.]